jgi:hypothetical protein
MALNFDFSGCAEEVKGDALYHEVEEHGEKVERLVPVADALVWLSMFVGYPKKDVKRGIKGDWAISEDNYKEYAKRIAIYEKCFGALLMKEDKESGELSERPILEEDVKKYIGLRSNGGSKSRAEFNKDIVRILWERVGGER